MEDNKDNLGLNEQPSENTETTEEIISEDTPAVEETAVTEETISDTKDTDDITEETEAIDEAAEEISEDIKEASDEETAVISVETSVETAQPSGQEPKKKKKGIVKKIFKAFGILLFLAFLTASAFVGYKVWEYMQVYVYTVQYKLPAAFENENISLTIDNIEIIDEIIGFEMDENYVYIGVRSTITNKTQEALDWKSFPLLMIKQYVRDEEDTGYVLVENTDQGYEMTGLRNYAIDLELDLRPAQDNLEAGASRTTADIFKILKTDYSENTYFLTTDIFNEIIILPSLPDIPVDETTAE